MAHDIGQDTIADICLRTGKKLDSVRKQWSRTMSRPFDRTYIPTMNEIILLNLSGSTENAKEKMKRAIAGPAAAKERSPVISKDEAATKKTTSGGRKIAMFTLMAAPAIASLQNMLHVTADITHDGLAAILFTYAFTATPFLFVVFGATGRLSMALTGALIAVELFCNTVRIYGGLTGFGGSGYPTRFLGIVTEIFNSGTYQTATVIAVILSSLAAAVLYKAYFEYQKI